MLGRFNVDFGNQLFLSCKSYIFKLPDPSTFVRVYNRNDWTKMNELSTLFLLVFPMLINVRKLQKCRLRRLNRHYLPFPYLDSVAKDSGKLLSQRAKTTRNFCLQSSVNEGSWSNFHVHVILHPWHSRTGEVSCWKIIILEIHLWPELVLWEIWVWHHITTYININNVQCNSLTLTFIYWTFEVISR